MRNVLRLGVVGLAVGGLVGCDLVTAALGFFSQIDLLGVVPAAGYADPSSADYGKVTFGLGARDDIGAAIAPALDEVEVVSDDGQDVHVDGGAEVEGNDRGSFVLVVDGSGSTEADVYCDGCPTDPERIRVEAAKQLALELGECSGRWRMSMVEFGRDEYPGAHVNHLVADWTTDGEEVAAAADGLSSGWGTPLWDGTFEAIERLERDLGSAFEGEKVPVGQGLVVISDGVDTMSNRSFDDVVSRARELGLAIHTVGFGPASDSVVNPDTSAVEGLRRLAEATGGTYGYVSDVDQLPALATAIGGAMCGGYTQVVATYEEPAPTGSTMTGLLRLKSHPEMAVPFTFTAP